MVSLYAHDCGGDKCAGRIGRIVFRNALANPEIEIVAINECVFQTLPSSSTLIVVYFAVFL